MNARALSIHLLGLLILAMLFVPAAAVLAQEGGFSGPIVPCDGVERQCNFCMLANLIQNIINFGVYASVLAGGAMFAYAGFLYLSNMGDPGKISKAHGIFKQVLVGLLIILSAWLLIDIIMKSLVQQDGGFGPWNRICSVELEF